MPRKKQILNSFYFFITNYCGKTDKLYDLKYIYSLGYFEIKREGIFSKIIEKTLY